ncbi:asparagine synthase (glutamine-hydrolyzing) [Gammaproteobacteria bacterium]|jgi:asparagine synthase (glutamine-hydrolysing)|nr:asparagine synthase (glutamine-hydrolyzing) [Gammaproteobacteria bacterium]
MCGFAGFIGGPSFDSSLKDSIENMTESLIHRGPDSSGIWISSMNKLALGHNRLAVQDLSEMGHQPMESPSSRYLIVFNGEIYNHLELRKKINSSHSQPVDWRGSSDTETILVSIEVFGLNATLQMCKGMFAFALWDQKSKKLFLARDCAGEKPLYYGEIDNSFVFGSELKALKRFPNFQNTLSSAALNAYFQYGYIPSPHSIYKNIYKVEPGTYVEFNASTEINSNYKKVTYWSLQETISESKEKVFVNPDSAISAIEETMNNSVRSQMISDVPLGVFLSGGVDSSLIAALAQKNSHVPIKTFTIGFENPEFDESQYAEDVARHIGTNHTKYLVSDSDVLNLIPHLPRIYDEPFADSSQIPTYFVCRAAKQEVTVALSGDAGDELFGGYNRYIFSSNIWTKVSWLPKFIRQLLGSLLIMIPVNVWNRLKKLFLFKNFSLFGNKVHKVGVALKNSSTLNDFYLSFSYIWENTSDILIEQNLDSRLILKKNYFGTKVQSYPAEQMMFYDLITYLPDDILCKVDRAAMSVSLETRAPFLDKNVISDAWRLPLSFKIKSGEGKWLLKEILYKYVPKKMLDRPKAGFALPIGDWLRGPLMKWAEDLLDKQTIDEQGYLNSDNVEKIWKQHLSGKYDWTAKLWTVLMFQAWLKQE